jgi:hypothetical protein
VYVNTVLQTFLSIGNKQITARTQEAATSLRTTPRNYRQQDRFSHFFSFYFFFLSFFFFFSLNRECIISWSHLRSAGIDSNTARLWLAALGACALSIRHVTCRTDSS